jgi:hypothetical protein
MAGGYFLQALGEKLSRSSHLEHMVADECIKRVEKRYEKR